MKKKKSILFPAMCILLSLALCSCKPYSIDEAKGHIITESSANGSDTQNIVYENNLFGFGVHLDGFIEVVDADHNPKNSDAAKQNTTSKENTQSSRFDDLEAIDSESHKYLWISLTSIKNGYSRNLTEEALINTFSEDRRKQLVINGYVIREQENSQISIAGEEHYAFQATYFKSGIEYKEDIILITKSNIRIMIYALSQNNENGVQEILDAFYKL